jgi:solute carrier family 44 protein 1 (choline transporter-like protein)
VGCFSFQPHRCRCCDKLFLVTKSLFCNWHCHVIFFRFNFKQDNNQGWLSLALISTVFTIIIIILFVVMFKRIQLIIQLYKETTKAIFAMPAIIFLPLITLIIQVLVLTLMIVTSVWMATARELKKDQQNTYQYHQNGAMQFAMAFNIIVTIWALQFFAGCQYMTLAGSVAQWFFKKNQANSPIVVSFTNTMRFHLGTIALGSFIITLMALIRAVIRSLINNNKLKWLCDCCCGNLEALLKFLSKNSYIETGRFSPRSNQSSFLKLYLVAIHGQSFFRSGKRAAKQLITNAGSVIALNSVGDFVMVMTQFILVAISTAIAYALFLDSPNNLLLPTVISFILNLIIVVIIFGVFGTTVDTLFICFCEDKSINDGTTKPYYMSKGLMQFVENSKKFYKEN